MHPFAYHHPREIKALLGLMQQNNSNFRLLAGGTDLLIRIKTGRIAPDTLIDIKSIPELNCGIKQEADIVKIGALTLMATLENDPLIKQYFPALAEAVHNVGSVQIRNRATIAGNLCNASPAADSAPALLIYKAMVRCISHRGDRILPLSEFILGPGKTALAPDELLQEIILPMPEADQFAAFARLTRRKGVDLATINLCCQVSKKGITRFVLGAVGPIPIMVEEADGYLSSSTVSADQKRARIEQLMVQAAPISDIRASKEYRQAMLSVLGQRALEKALENLRAAN